MSLDVEINQNWMLSKNATNNNVLRIVKAGPVWCLCYMFWTRMTNYPFNTTKVMVTTLNDKLMNRFPDRLVRWFYKVCAAIWNCTKDSKGVQLTNCWHGTNFLTINLEEILLEFKNWILFHDLRVFSLR